MDNEPKKYTKLSLLVNDSFTVEKVDAFVYKRWNPQTAKMEVSQDWKQDFKKVYPVTTDKGQLDLGTGQIGSLLEAVFHAGKADLIGQTFDVKSNGQSGMDIRYYFNPVKTKDVVVEPIDGEPVSLEDIPF